MSQEYIEIRGARENNLKNISLRIPKRKITIFTGVSGSGKSSIVFDTIATEAQRQLYETFSMFVRNFLPRYAQPLCRRLVLARVTEKDCLGSIGQVNACRNRAAIGEGTDSMGFPKADEISRTEVGGAGHRPLARTYWEVERVMGIEPTLAAWEAAVLPLNYTRVW